MMTLKSLANADLSYNGVFFELEGGERDLLCTGMIAGSAAVPRSHGERAVGARPPARHGR
jgi:hypothetical protein